MQSIMYTQEQTVYQLCVTRDKYLKACENERERSIRHNVALERSQGDGYERSCRFRRSLWTNKKKKKKKEKNRKGGTMNTQRREET